MAKATQPTISVIIPVYNASAYLKRALDSVFVQEIPGLQIVAVNDGSTDDSLDLLQTTAKSRQDMVIINQTNHGQGYARNRAIEHATGDYILFLDADDWLSPDALSSLLGAAGSDVDVVHCGWQAGNTGQVSHRPSYLPSEVFPPSELQGAACDEFLRLPNYFSVNNLFRRTFLLDNHIRFGEGYVYEDNEFMVAVANRARRINFVDEPLYIVNFHGDSSTRGAFTTDKHYRDFLVAVGRSFEVLTPRLAASRAYLASYFLEKFIIYYQRRVPARYKRAYAHDFVDLMARQDIKLPPEVVVSKFLLLCLRLGIFRQQSYGLFAACIFYKTHLLPLIKR